MAEMIIQNPSITTNVFEYDEVGRVSAIAGHPLAGEGGGTIVKSDLMWKPTVASDGYVRWTLASSATIPDAAYISGAQGPAGKDGTNGTNGKDGEDGEDGISLSATSTELDQQRKTQVQIGQVNGPVQTTFELPWGQNGVSPTVSTSAIPGGSRVIFTYDNGGTPATESIDVMSGASGANGSDGFSPTVTITDAPTTTTHPQGGKTVTITDINHLTGQSFDIWNGINGEGATVNLLDGNGIHITNDGTNYTIGVSADYALKSELPDVTDMATKTWVGQEGFLKSSDLTDYATKTYANDASAYALSQAESWVETEGYLKSVSVATNSSIDGTGTTNNPLSLKTSAEQALAAVDGKVSKPDANYQHKFAIWDNQDKGWVNPFYYFTQTLDCDIPIPVTAKQYVMGGDLKWQELTLPSVPDITATNGISADGYKIGLTESVYSAIQEISAANDLVGANGISVVAGANNQVIIAPSGISPAKQYAMTTTGWEEVQASTTETAYVPLSGGTVSGELVVSGTSGDFNTQFLKLIREGVVGHARIGLGNSGPLAFKVDDTNNHTTQVNISPNNSNDQLIQVQHNNNEVGYLIPAKIHQGSYTPTSADGILHIVLES